MSKNKPYMSQNLAYLLSEFYNASKKSICFITKNDSESKLLLNELKYFLKPEEVLWFPESEILPYDHFSIPNKITKKRFAILNKENDSKNMIITSVKNLFERFPSIEYFKSSGSFDTNTRISIDELDQFFTMPIKTYKDYPNDSFLYNLGSKLLRFLGKEIGGKL